LDHESLDSGSKVIDPTACVKNREEASTCSSRRGGAYDPQLGLQMAISGNFLKQIETETVKSQETKNPGKHSTDAVLQGSACTTVGVEDRGFEPLTS
jgi:hypothetical protein